MGGRRGAQADQSLDDEGDQGEGDRRGQSPEGTCGEAGDSHQAWLQGVVDQRKDQEGHTGGEGMACPCGAESGL